MSIVVDANVVKGYYDEVVIDVRHSLTQSAVNIFETITNVIYVDNQEFIESEWKRVVDPEWFDVWYSDSLRSGKISMVDVKNCKELCESLYKIGFPKGERDVWYVRTAKATLTFQKECFIITEDIDFYDPKKKKIACGIARIKCMKSPSSPVRRCLRKKEKILVMCVEEFLTR